MRKVLVVLVGLSLVGALVFLWRATFVDPAPHRRRDAAQVEPPRAEEAVRAAPVLPVKNGVARAPDFDAAPEETARCYWIGRAVRAATGQGVERAGVTVEELKTGRRVGQPPTREGGYFTARIDEKIEGAWRIVIESDEGEVGVRSVGAGDVVEVGTVYLKGQHALSGRALFDRDRPAPDASLFLRRFGELSPDREPVAFARTADDGTFEFKKVPEGTYVLEGTGPESATYLAYPVVVPGPPRTVRPVHAASLPFVVVNTLGEPVAGASVELRMVGLAPEIDPLGLANVVRPARGATAADGSGVIESLLPGRYKVRVSTMFVTREFDVAHGGAWRAPPARFTMPVDGRVSVRFVESPAGDPPVPLRRTKVRVTIDGKEHTFTTDAEGLARIPGPGRGTLVVAAETEDRTGGGRLQPYEGLAPQLVEMEPRVASAQAQRPRRVKVVTPDGQPVQGARAYLEWGGITRPRRRTDERGEAVLGEAPDGVVIRLYRPDFASGDPESAEMHLKDHAELVWIAGREIVVTVRDDVDKFPISRRVVVRPRPRAWKRVGPGTFRARWDDAVTGTLEVEAEGYETWTHPVTEASDYVADLLPHREDTATLELEVVDGNTPVPGVRLRLFFDGPAGGAVPGRTEVAALSGAVKVRIPNLRVGTWTLFADGNARGSVATRLALAPGRNRFVARLGRSAYVRGRVLDERKRGVEGVVLAPRKGTTLGVVRTTRRGHFRINLPAFDGKRHFFRATSPGYVEQVFAVVASPKTRPVVVVLKRPGFAHLTLVWSDGRADPLPGDLEFRIEPGGRRVRPMGGRLMLTLAPGRHTLVQERGSAWVPNRRFLLKPGQVFRSSLRLGTGGSAEGRVLRDGRPVPNRLLFLARRGRPPVPARTNERGEFVVRGLAPGSYAIHTAGQTEQSRAENGRLAVQRGRATHGLIVTVR